MKGVFMSGNVWCLFAIMVIYMLLMVAIGLYFSKKNKNTSDFYLGGRKLGPFVTAMSAEASDSILLKAETQNII